MRINLGKMQDGVELNINLHNEGSILLTGQTGVGKSCIVMNIAIQAAKKRQVIIFSYGDEYNNIVYSNPYSLQPDCLDVSKTNVVENCKVKISDFDDLTDWMYLGLGTGAFFCSSLAKQVEMHQNIPAQFMQIILKTPTSRRGSQEDTTLHPAVLESITTRWQEFESYFALESVDWKEAVGSGKNIIINLGLSKSEKRKAQQIVGHILRKISPIVEKTHPMFIFEEADILLEDMSYSQTQIINYHLKKAKERLFFIFVSQMEFRVPRDIDENIKIHISGKMPAHGESFFAHLVNSIRWEPLKGYREFVYHDRTNGMIVKFFPRDVPCFIKRRF